MAVLLGVDVPGATRAPGAGVDSGQRVHALVRVRPDHDTQLGGDLYRKRKGMIEPLFANTKFNRGIDRYLRRGRSAVRSEWRLITAIHNLLKLHTHQLATAAP